ncbi:MAG TPA: FecR family protein [Kofleriaceae bacterium]|nr:FecR family protein [Kofleriaceae bacterium]
MNLVGKVPVEPLDEERLTNIERKLVVQVSEMSQRPHRAPRRGFAYAGFAMAVAIAGFVGWKLHRDPVVEPAKPEQLAMKAGALDLGDAQITGSDFDITRTAALTMVVMHPGKLDLHVEHKPGRVFVVQAGDVEIEDIGTRFTVDYDGKNVDVRVTEGEVKVKRAGKELRVTAGNAWTLEIGPITIAQLTAQQAQTVGATNPQPQATAQNNVVAMAPTNNAGSGSGVGSAQGSGASRPAKTPQSNAKRAIDNLPLEPLVATDLKDPKAAIAEYLKTVRDMPEGEDKAELLQSIAVMQLRQKDLDGAAHSIKGILQRQGGDTPAYKQALWLDMRIKCATSYDRDNNRDGKADRLFDDDCRRSAERYIVKFPTGAAAGVAQEVLNEISRGQ